MDSDELQRRIGYSFAGPALLARALTHRSYAAAHNERLEFLGDSVLNCVVAEELYRRYDGLDEGDLSRLRANLVRQDALHQVAQSIALGECLRLGEGELKSGGAARPSMLADALEALVGAIFLDGGFDAARRTIEKLYRPLFAELDPSDPAKDAKTRLQELLQARKIALPQYSVLRTQGAAHSQQFEVECLIAELAVRTTGSGTSRRLAEQQAALRAFEQLHG